MGKHEETVKGLFDKNKSRLVELFPSFKEARNNYQKTSVIIDGVYELETLEESTQGALKTVQKSLDKANLAIRSAKKDINSLTKQRAQLNTKVKGLKTSLAEVESEKSIELDRLVRITKERNDFEKQLIDQKVVNSNTSKANVKLVNEINDVKHDLSLYMTKSSQLSEILKDKTEEHARRISKRNNIIITGTIVFIATILTLSYFI